MSVDVHEIDREGLGGHSAEDYADAAVAGAKALIEFDPSQERWVMPLVRAIALSQVITAHIQSMDPERLRQIGVEIAQTEPKASE